MNFPSKLKYLANDTSYLITKLRYSTAISSCCSVCSHFDSCILNQKNKFKLFEVPQSLSIDEMFLKRKFYFYQKFMHPDRFYKEDINSLRKIKEHSAYLNKSYKVLKKILPRGKHLFEIKCSDNGLKSENLEFYDTKASEYKLNNDDLEKMMNIDTNIQEIKAQRDIIRSSDSYDEKTLSKIESLRELQQELEVEIESSKSSFVENLNSGKQNCTLALRSLIFWNYYSKKIMDINESLYYK